MRYTLRGSECQTGRSDHSGATLEQEMPSSRLSILAGPFNVAFRLPRPHQRLDITTLAAAPFGFAGEALRSSLR